MQNSGCVRRSLSPRCRTSRIQIRSFSKCWFSAPPPRCRVGQRASRSPHNNGSFTGIRAGALDKLPRSRKRATLVTIENPCAELGRRWVSAVRCRKSTQGVSADRTGEPVVSDESYVIFSPFLKILCIYL